MVHPDTPYSFNLGDRSVDSRRALINALMAARYGIGNSASQTDINNARDSVLTDLYTWDHPYGESSPNYKLYIKVMDKSIHLKANVSEDAISKISRLYLNRLLCCVFPSRKWKFKGCFLEDFCEIQEGHPDFNPCKPSKKRRPAFGLFPPPPSKDWSAQFLQFWHSTMRSYITLHGSYKLPTADATHASSFPVVREAIDQFTAQINTNTAFGQQAAGSLLTNIHQEIAKNESAHDRRTKTTYAARHDAYHGSANDSKGKDLKLAETIDHRNNKLVHLSFISSVCILGIIDCKKVPEAPKQEVATDDNVFFLAPPGGFDSTPTQPTPAPAPAPSTEDNVFFLAPPGGFDSTPAAPVEPTVPSTDENVFFLAPPGGFAS